MKEKITTMSSGRLAAAVISVSVLIGLVPLAIQMTSVNHIQQKQFSNVSLYQAENESGNLSLGVDPADGLEFGERPVDAVTGGDKDLDFNAEKKSLILISAEGNISEVLEFEDRHYFEGAKTVPVRFTTDHPVGYYEGNVTINIYAPKNRVGEAWLDMRSQLSSW